MKYQNSFKSKLIYVFRINDAAHEGCLKIGEATASGNDDFYTLEPNSSPLNKAAKKRIDQYTQTAGIAYDLLHTELAIYAKDGNWHRFSDSEVHRVLIRSDIKKKVFDTENKANEWFITDLETVKKAITAVKQGKNSLHPDEVSEKFTPVSFRPEQKEAIEKTIRQFKRGNEMLWFAKMRFGKTLSALQVVKQSSFVRTLILTHRPVVDSSWFDDFHKIFSSEDNYLYGSKNRGEEFNTLEARCFEENKKYVYFASMQDLRGSDYVGGSLLKNNEIFGTLWNLIIVDEAHEGTQTELGKNVLEELRTANTKILHLSGTPFNLLDNYKEDEIYTWDYVMEQRAKAEWDKIHFGDPNPYASLPKLNIFTYDLGKLLKSYIDEEVAFNFREFFRVNPSGEFIHDQDVLSFLDLICKSDEESNYPYSTSEYRQNFRHSLWMVPGVKEARALSKKLRQHVVFSSFEIVNVAGEGDEEQANDEALRKVEKAIGDKPHETYTITLSCGRLTTGVSVQAWTSVFMLSGSYNTSASAYMQTIFRVQTPATINGKVKEECFVFDFAPDRTLKVIAEAAKISAKVGKTSGLDRTIMGEFLNFCPIIAVHGSQMKNYDVNGMLEQLKKVYVERVVKNGFEDGYLYNNDQLMNLGAVELKEFEGLKKILGKTKAIPKIKGIDINNQGFTEEEYETLGIEKNKPPKELTEEEKQKVADLIKNRKIRENAISILKGISIRMPLLIYGADVEQGKEDHQITIDNFTELIDDRSWEEFMPKGVTKQTFQKFKKYYEPDIFRAAGKRIRALARAADQLSVEERIERITAIFSTFRNPDKETVLTPWRVVNMHLGDCLGGYVFLDASREKTVTHPAFVSQGDVTMDVFSTTSRVLEINSKSGLYPLYVTYSIFRNRLKEVYPDKDPNILTVQQQITEWDKTVAENVFVICKTPMAKSITKRTLIGFRTSKVNTHYFEDLVNQIKNKPDNFIKKVKKGQSYWKANNDEDMKFNAIVGNPPYQVLDGGGSGESAVPVYNHFVEIAKSIKPKYISMIIPAKWYSGGKGLDDFRNTMLNDFRIFYLADYPDSRECFPTVDVAGGICYFLRDDSYFGICNFESFSNGQSYKSKRKLNEYDTLVRNITGENIIKRIQTFSTSTLVAYSRNPFGLTNKQLTNSHKFNDSIPVFSSKGIFYVKKNEISVNTDLISKWKVIISKTSSEHAGQTDKNGKKRVLSRIEILPPDFVCSESYLLINIFDNEQHANNLKNYLSSKFLRFLLSTILLTQNISKKMFSFVPLQDFTSHSDIDWTKSIPEIDKQLYTKYNLSEEEIQFIESMIKPMAD